ncbi:MAG TPA: peptidase T [Bacteroidales bacterium]|nr:peptidase T [Bacteroidales bacterium]
MKNIILQRFLKYVKIDTQSDENSKSFPSTLKQFDLAHLLVEELKSIGMVEVCVDDKGYVMATLPANISQQVPVIGFIAHLDTSPDMPGSNVNPCIIENYNGKDILLNEELNLYLSPTEFPELNDYKGQTLIVTDGKTLLGADDKAGIAEIITAMEYLINNPNIKHGKVRIAFTPDEEIGKGVDYFDVKKFGADYAYTIDGGGIGELEYENFNAAMAKISIQGRNVHPGYAKDKMINALLVAIEINNLLPVNERPEFTSNYEGFFHLIKLEGSVEKAFMQYIIRDHDLQKFIFKKQLIEEIVKIINLRYNNIISLQIKDQYYNMREKIEPVFHIIEIAKKAMEEENIIPRIVPIRGGTDGARLSYMGLPCPNIFTGGHNFHGKMEFIPLESMLKATKVIINIVKKFSEINKCG